MGGKSPYVRYKKTPYQYSTNYRQWRSAVMDGKARSADYHAREHEKQFGYRRPRKFEDRSDAVIVE
jgi:hypothetical protein